MKNRFTLLFTVLGLSSLLGLLLSQANPSYGQRQEGGLRFGVPPKFSPEDKEKFRQRLGISVQQQEQMDTLFTESQKQRRILSARLRELFDQRHAVCDVYDFDRGREHALRKEISQVYNQILKIHLDTEEKLRRILNREQFERLRALRQEAMRAHQENRRKSGFRGKGRPDGAPSDGKP